jgi:hypothetical protein
LDEAATSLIVRGAANLQQFKMKNGWVILESVAGAPPFTDETVNQIEDEYFDEELKRALSPRR